MSLELSAKDVILVGAGLAGGGLISYLIARNVIHRSRLHYSLILQRFSVPGILALLYL